MNLFVELTKQLLEDLKTLFRPEPVPRPRRPRVRPSPEGLEDRTTPAQFNWIGPNGGDWYTTANWAENAVPGLGDIANFGFAGNPNTAPFINSDITVGMIDCWSGYSGTFVIEDAVLTVENDFLGAGGYGGMSTTTNITVLDSGADSVFAGIHVGDLFDIGGVFTISNGSSEAVSISASTLLLRGSATWIVGGGGTLGNATMSGLLWQLGTVNVTDGGALSLAAGGVGGWWMDAGSATFFDAATIVYSGNTPADIGGLLDFGNANGGTLVCSVGSPGINVASGGVLRVWVNSFITGNLNNSAGTVKFMNAFATLSVTGNYSQFLGTLEAHIDSSLASSSLLAVSGNVSLGGILRVIDDAPSEERPVLVIISAGGTGSGSFSTYDFPSGGTFSPGWVDNSPFGDVYVI